MRFVVRPLFAALPPARQLAVFEPAPPQTRKIVLATNIAEVHARGGERARLLAGAGAGCKRRDCGRACRHRLPFPECGTWLIAD
jgi:hypothetical protein